METILRVNDLSVSFDIYDGEVQAVRGVTFELNKKETLAIVGESGSGKSVTAKAIMQLLPKPAARIKTGEILFDGHDLTRYSEKQMQKIRGSEISMIFQDPMTSLNPTMSVGNQIMEGLRKHQKLSKRDALERSIELLELVGIPNPTVRVKQYPHQFSGGMRQRVVIAIALACNPKILIADEPTTALDVTIQAQILELMRNIQEKMGTAIILITHDLGVVAKMADRVAVMYAGKIVESGNVDEIFYNPRHPYTWGLLGAMPTPESSKDELIAIPGSPPDMTNPPIGDAFAPRNAFAMKIDTMMDPPMFKVSETHYAATWLLHEKAPKVVPPIFRQKTEVINEAAASIENREMLTNEKLVEVKNLKRYFKMGRKAILRAVDDISFDIYRGETFGLVGESGCGKSTTGRTILRLYEATDGQVKFMGQDVHGRKSAKELKSLNRKMQMIFQDPYASLNPRMTVEDIIAEGLDIHGLAKSKKERKHRVSELLDIIRLSKNHANRFPHEFSGGQRQRIGIARALAVKPEFIVADEPISALDVSIQAQIINLMKQLQKEFGLTYLFIAHDLSMVKYISDRIGVMYAGQLVELADSDELYKYPVHPYTKSLISAIPLPDPAYRDQKRLDYEPTPNPSHEPVEFSEIRPKHWVRCTQSDFEKYQKERGIITPEHILV
jgi:peptide/nickel transport system ATP-binding protein